MRWDELFADLEAQAEMAGSAALAAEVDDRTRREHGLLRLVDRLRAAVGSPVELTLLGHGVVPGVLRDVGEDWALLEDARSSVLVRAAAVTGVTGLGARAEAPGSTGELARRLDLRWALRGLSRSREGVRLLLVDGGFAEGTVDRVGADHLDLAEHPAGEPRRPGLVRQVRLVPIAALAAVRSTPAG